MRSHHHRLSRVESTLTRRRAGLVQHNRALLTCISRAQLARQPEIAHVTADDTDPETFRHFRETLAWARGDHAEAERRKALEPLDHDKARILAEERGDHGRALARLLCARSPENQRRQERREAALTKARARMGVPS